jgi:hypothetical protein
MYTMLIVVCYLKCASTITMFPPFPDKASCLKVGRDVVIGFVHAPVPPGPKPSIAIACIGGKATERAA